MKVPIKLVQCKACERYFFVPRGLRICYCSKECRRNADNSQRRRKKLFPSTYPKRVKCKICRNEFDKQHNEVYCSVGCRVVGTRLMRRLKKAKYRKMLQIQNESIKKNFVPTDIYHNDWSKQMEQKIEVKIKEWGGLHEGV